MHKKKEMLQAVKHNSGNEQAQHLILKIRLAVATGHLEMLPELNSKLIQTFYNINIKILCL